MAERQVMVEAKGRGQGIVVRAEHLRDMGRVHLMPPKCRQLTLMLRHTGKVLTPRQLLKEVWGVSYAGQSHYVRVYMAQLRQKRSTS